MPVKSGLGKKLSQGDIGKKSMSSDGPKFKGKMKMSSGHDNGGLKQASKSKVIQGRG